MPRLPPPDQRGHDDAYEPVPIVAPDPPAPLLAPQVDPIRPSLADREPVALAGAIQGVLSALLAVLLGFGWVTLTDEQIGLLLGLYTAVVAAVQAFARGRAWSPASVARLVAKR